MGVYVLSWLPDFNEETRIPECEKPSNGAEALVTEARRESLSRLHDWIIIQTCHLEKYLAIVT